MTSTKSQKMILLSDLLRIVHEGEVLNGAKMPKKKLPKSLKNQEDPRLQRQSVRNHKEPRTKRTFL